MKSYLVVTPTDYETDRLTEVSKKAKLYYGEKDYSKRSLDPKLENEIKSILKELTDSSADRKSCNANLFILGVQLILFSQVDSVYFSKDWDSDDFCKTLHLMAFKYGLDIRYESF